MTAPEFKIRRPGSVTGRSTAPSSARRAQSSAPSPPSPPFSSGCGRSWKDATSPRRTGRLPRLLRVCILHAGDLRFGAVLGRRRRQRAGGGDGVLCVCVCVCLCVLASAMTHSACVPAPRARRAAACRAGSSNRRPRPRRSCCECHAVCRLGGERAAKRRTHRGGGGAGVGSRGFVGVLLGGNRREAKVRTRAGLACSTTLPAPFKRSHRPPPPPFLFPHP